MKTSPVMIPVTTYVEAVLAVMTPIETTTGYVVEEQRGGPRLQHRGVISAVALGDIIFGDWADGVRSRRRPPEAATDWREPARRDQGEPV